MNIKIDDNYRITGDSMQYILQERKERKEIKIDPKTGKLEGKYYYVNVGYFGKIYYALQAFKELQIRNSDVTSVDELLKLIKELDFKIEKLLGGN